MARVKKIMLTNVPTLKKEAKIGEAAKLLAQNQSGCVVIVENNKPIGIVTELDFVRNLPKSKNFNDLITKIMSSPVVAINPATSLEKASKIIDTRHFRRYPVVNGDALLGIVTEHDIVQAINDNIKFHRNLQNAILIVFVIFEFFVFVLYHYLKSFFPF